MTNPASVMISRIRELFPSFITGLLNSYSLVFFSNNKIFAVILMAVTFLDPWAGISGICAIIISNFTAYILGLNRISIRFGYYGFNSLLVALGLGIFYQPSLEFYVLLLFTSLLTLLLTVVSEGLLGKNGLPFLSISFLLSIWLVSLAARQFASLEVSERGIFVLNEMYAIGDLNLVDTYRHFLDFPMPDSLRLYFRSLGAIFFQYHLFAGILVALGLLIYSRIAFLLSLLGFFSAYAYYYFIGADISELSAGYIGFNFILTAIAIGGFFIIPSWYSFLCVLLLTPVVSLVLTSTMTLFAPLQLSIYSLPFNMVVLAFLYTLRLRERFTTKPELVLFQQYSPEKNLYSLLNYRTRFGKAPWVNLSLPFYGTWTVTQGESGDLTHKGDWKHAWDFEILDDENKSYSGQGNVNEDYYSFNKPVLATADGYVEEVADTVDDNLPGLANVEQNWGNSIVIRHDAHLYTKVSHLKKGSVKVAKGDFVRVGTVLASCGNSGRSPFPHIHFQVQTTPFIGSRTLDYPLGNYISETKDTRHLHAYEKPKLGERVQNILPEEALTKAFRLIPGQKFTIKAEGTKGSQQQLAWEVMSDPYNNTYLYCSVSQSKAWFVSTGSLTWFTHYEGDRKSLLFYFYLGAYKTIHGFYPGLVIRDQYPLSLLRYGPIHFLHDFMAPFWQFIRADYRVTYLKQTEDLLEPEFTVSATSSISVMKRVTKTVFCDFIINNRGITKMIVREKEKEVVLIFCDENEV